MMLEENFMIPVNYLSSLTVEPEHLYIYIKDKHYRKLEKQRNNALKNNHLDAENTRYLPAKIRFQDEMIKVKLRLKGIQKDHWETDKWSLRIQTRGRKLLFGMKRFSLQHPRTRSYVYEWLFHKVLQNEGILYRRYKFVNVTINDKFMGLYALEENFDKRMIENSRLREGPIIKDEQGINAYQPNKVSKDKTLAAQFLIAKNLLDLFYHGHLKTSQVFDTEKMARLLALTDVFSAQHAIDNINIRYYYNPITSMLEPIGSDASILLERNGIASLISEQTAYQKFFDEEAFVQKYIRELQRLSTRSYLEDFFLEIEEELDNNLKLIYSNYPYFTFSTELFYANQVYIKQALSQIAVIPRKTNDAPPSDVLREFMKTDLIRQSANVEEFEFLKINKQEQTITLPSGKWELRHPLILPENYKFVIEQGTQLHLFNFAKIISYASLEFLGEVEQPIVIDSPDGTGRGIVVIQAKSKSILKHVVFKNQSNLEYRGWSLTGAINFYESPVDFYKAAWINTHSEDALNIVRSQFTIDHSTLSNVDFDAIDVDFGEGQITNTTINECGNDGIDVSGSRVRIEHVVIDQCRDKALSVGEESQVQVRDIRISEANVALTSKDRSEVVAENITIQDTKFGVAIFEKKAEFGPSQMSIHHLKMKNIKTPYLIEHGSQLMVDGIPIESNRKKVNKILYKKNK